MALTIYLVSCLACLVLLTIRFRMEGKAEINKIVEEFASTPPYMSHKAINTLIHVAIFITIFTPVFNMYIILVQILRLLIPKKT